MLLLALVILVLLTPVQVAVVTILGRFFLEQAKGPLSRLREPAIRRDFLWLMLCSGFFTIAVVFLLSATLLGGP